MSGKEITSLLFYSVAESRSARAHIKRLTETLARSSYGHVVPLEERDLGDGKVKWLFDFTEILANAAYGDALSHFLETNEQFLLDVLTVDPAFKYELSALLSVDEKLAAFEIEVPRIPAALSAHPSFRFSYFVWHVASGENDEEGVTPDRLQ